MMVTSTFVILRFSRATPSSGWFRLTKAVLFFSGRGSRAARAGTAAAAPQTIFGKSLDCSFCRWFQAHSEYNLEGQFQLSVEVRLAGDHAEVRISISCCRPAEDRMIQQVERRKPELRLGGFREPEVLGKRRVHVVHAR